MAEHANARVQRSQPVQRRSGAVRHEPDDVSGAEQLVRGLQAAAGNQAVAQALGGPAVQRQGGSAGRRAAGFVGVEPGRRGDVEIVSRRPDSQRGQRPRGRAAGIQGRIRPDQAGGRRGRHGERVPARGGPASRQGELPERRPARWSSRCWPRAPTSPSTSRTTRSQPSSAGWSTTPRWSASRSAARPRRARSSTRSSARAAHPRGSRGDEDSGPAASPAYGPSSRSTSTGRPGTLDDSRPRSIVRR